MIGIERHVGTAWRILDLIVKAVGIMNEFYTENLLQNVDTLFGAYSQGP
jgi:hypothetical protein